MGESPWVDSWSEALAMLVSLAMRKAFIETALSIYDHLLTNEPLTYEAITAAGKLDAVEVSAETGHRFQFQASAPIKVGVSPWQEDPSLVRAEILRGRKKTLEEKVNLDLQLKVFKQAALHVFQALSEEDKRIELPDVVRADGTKFYYADLLEWLTAPELPER